MKTIVVHSIHSREGKTKVAKELAGYLQLQGKAVLLADLDFITDPHRRALGLPSSPNLQDLINDINARAKKKPLFDIHFSPEEVNKYLLTHNIGLRVLSSENSQYLAQDEEIAQKIRIVIRSLKQLPFDYIIVDTDSSNRDYTQVILTEADHVLIVMDNFRYNLKDLIQYLKKLKSMNFSTKNFKIVLNKVPSPVQPTIEEIQQESGLKVIGIVPVLDNKCYPTTDTEDICLSVADPKNTEFIAAVHNVLTTL